MQLRPEFGPKLPLKRVLRSSLEANVTHRPAGTADMQDENFLCSESGELGKLLAAWCTALADLSHKVVGLGSNLCRQQWWLLQKIKCYLQLLSVRGALSFELLTKNTSTTLWARFAARAKPDWTADT